MAQTVDDVLANAELYSDGYSYRFVKLPPNAITVAAGIIAEAGNPFMALLADKDEVTLMLEDEDYQEYKNRLRNHEVSDTLYRLITFDIVLEPTLVGLMARITQVLAAAQISVMPFAAYSRDHIFVGEADFDRAIQVLQQLKATQ
jgi:hypothetical protein